MANFNGVYYPVGSDTYDLPADFQEHAQTDAQQALDAAALASGDVGEAVLAEAKAYADTGDATTLTAAQAYAADQDDLVRAYADTGDANTLTAAKQYTDDEVAAGANRIWNEHGRLIVDSEGGLQYFVGAERVAWLRPSGAMEPIVLSTEDLNAVTVCRSYLQNINGDATLARNYPWEGVAGNLHVLPLNQAMTNYTQVYIPHNSFGSGIATRSFRAGEWTPWSIMAPGGIGEVGQQLTTQNLDNVLQPGNYWTRLNTEATLARNYPVEAFGNLQVTAQHTNLANLTQTYTPNQEWGNGYFMRSRYNAAWGEWEHYAGLEGVNVDVFKGIALTTEHLDTIDVPGAYWQRVNAEATPERSYPFEVAGNLTVTSWHVNDGNITQTYTPAQNFAGGIAVRSRYNGTWSDWSIQPTQEQTRGLVTEAMGDVAGSARPGSGFKVVPLILTAGQSDVNAPTSQHYRVPLNFNAPITRWRLHIRNTNPRLGGVRTGAVSFTGLWHGEHAGDGAFATAPTQLRGGFATPADGSDWTSAWFNAPLGDNTDYLLSFGYTAPSAPYSLIGGAWRSASPADAAATAPAVTKVVQAPFSMWVEAETYATTPVVAVFGDSLSVGVGSTLPVHDSWLSQKMRTDGGLPVHYAHSGDSMLGWANTSADKWTRWSHLARPDSVVVGIGSNDLARGDSLNSMQALLASTLANLESRVSSTIYLANIMPRNGWPVGSSEEATRRTYNTWLGNLPLGTRDVFDFAASISDDDETIKPEYNADGTHLNTAGYAQNALAVVRPIMAPAPLYA